MSGGRGREGAVGSSGLGIIKKRGVELIITRPLLIKNYPS